MLIVPSASSRALRVILAHILTQPHTSPDQIYHVTVMPCYDKKLEASRQDFYSEAYATRDVDCVITTGELQLLMQEKGWDLSVPVPDENVPQRHDVGAALGPEAAVEDRRPASGRGTGAADLAFPELLIHPGTSSGSYLHSVISNLIATAADSGALELATKTVRTADYEEYTLTDRVTGEVVFRGAKCYGFRNLQNVVRKVGRNAGVQVGRGAAGRLAGAGLRARGRAVRKGAAGAEGAAQDESRGYDYVEVMACPSGCVNGGGQLRPVQAAAGRSADEEGFARNWAETGVKMDFDEPLPAAPVGPKWGDREWTRKVEAAYWRTFPTPPPTPPADGAPIGTGQTFEAADRFAGRVLVETTKPGETVQEGVKWTTKLDEVAEARRQQLFRTQYRAVESEVVGLAVKW